MIGAILQWKTSNANQWLSTQQSRFSQRWLSMTFPIPHTSRLLWKASSADPPSSAPRRLPVLAGALSRSGRRRGVIKHNKLLCDALDPAWL